MMKILAVILFCLPCFASYAFEISSESLAAVVCPTGETEVTRDIRSERAPCVTGGMCNGWGINPQTGDYEYFYGYHEDCDGVKSREVTEVKCSKADGSTHIVRVDGPYGVCTIL